MDTIIDIHSHLLSMQYIPDDVSRTSSGITENSKFIKWLVKHVCGKNTQEFFAIMNAKTLIEIAKIAVDEMDQSGVAFTTPMLMDLWPGSINSEPEIQNNNSPYECQLNDFFGKDGVLQQFPWRFMPFVMFDPRRKDSFEKFTDSYNKGAIGVKMYPAMGYNPNPRMYEDHSKIPAKISGPNSIKKYDLVQENLIKLYEFCQGNNIPITTHVTPGGSLPGDMKPTIKDRMENEVWVYTDPNNWIDVLNDYKVRVNFAHFGTGNYLLNEDDDDYSSMEKLKIIKGKKWRSDILGFIQRDDFQGKAFADLACHEEMCLSECSDETGNYFRRLDEELLTDKKTKSKILFGSDWPMNRRTCLLKQYVGKYKSELSESKFKLIAQSNSVKFLFGESGKIPENYINAVKTAERPNWVNEDYSLQFT